MLDINESLSKRLKFLTFVATCFVLLLHSGGRDLLQEQTDDICLVFDDICFNGIFSCAVPLFFAISGFLFTKNIDLRGRGYVATMCKRLISLGVPYVLWNFIHAFFIFLVDHLPLPNVLTLLGLNQFFPHHHALWYVKFLCVFFITSPMLMIVIRFFKRYPKVEIVGGLCLVALLCINRSGTLLGFMFYAIGFWSGFNYARISCFFKRNVGRALVICVGVTLGLLVARLVHTYYYAHCAQFLKCQTMAATTVLFCCFAAFSEKISRLKWIDVIVPFSFFVYCFHFVVTYLFKSCIWRIMPPVMAAFSVAALSGIASVVVAWGLHRYCSRVYCVLSGGR